MNVLCNNYYPSFFFPEKKQKLLKNKKMKIKKYESLEKLETRKENYKSDYYDEKDFLLLFSIFFFPPFLNTQKQHIHITFCIF